MMGKLQDLHDAIARGSGKSRERALWHACDMLIAGSYAEEDIWTFGEVIDRLSEEIESNVRARLAERMVQTDNAPLQTIRKLAMDDSIDVAGRVLQYSERLDVRTLLDAARTKGQQHLMAISKRRVIPEAVTDVLVERGEQPVLRSVAANPGAQMSEASFLHMVQRSQNDMILADSLGSRKDIPRHIFQQLIAKAGDNVRARLTSADAEAASIVADATGEIQSKFGPASPAYFTAKRKLSSQLRMGDLAEPHIRAHAEAHELAETIVGLSLLSGIPSDVVERTLTSRSRERALILGKGLGFAWETTMAMLFVAAPDYKIRAGEVDELREEYARLDADAARDVLLTYRSRKSASAAKSAPRALPQLHNV